ncbi:hypothetical protein BH09MYX1_BH09MYX1_40090 [soil metagenome]
MTRTRSLGLFTLALAFGTVAYACSQAPNPKAASRGPSPGSDASTTMRESGTEDDASTLDGSWSDDATSDADAFAPEDPMANHKETREELLTLFDIRPLSDAEAKTVRADLFLSFNFGPAVTRMNQGNKAIAKHLIGREACLRGLAGTVIQTDDQRARCGSPNMVPIYKNGDPNSAAYCIDVFEFPNRPCELPIVWAAPTHARTMCALEGKRLCTQNEWQLACRGDPSGGTDRRYAYGDELDLTVCNTNKRRAAPVACSPVSAKLAWETCSTETEPAGSYPRCRSRFGVYDQHGNVAEIMTRIDKDGAVVSQLKGSAWFYTEVARKHDEPQKVGGIETYPDHCNFDPRWHVEPIASAWHVNYHLGFRCCKSVTPAKSGDGGVSDAAP